MNGAFLRRVAQGYIETLHHDGPGRGNDAASEGQQLAQTHELTRAENEGFSRSISLYWRWSNGQKGASRVGKVS